MNVRKSIGIVAFGFGEPADLIPNRAIAAAAEQLAHAAEAEVVFTDRDVAPYLSPERLIIEETDPSRAPTTYRLAMLAAGGARRRGLTELRVVAAPCHISRCLRDLRWAARDSGIELTLVPHAIEGKQYDARASTWFTRSAWQWWPLEIAYRVASALLPAWYKRTRT